MCAWVGSVQSVFSYFSHFRTAANFQREPGPVKGREAIRAADAEGALDRTGLPRIIKRPEMGASHQTNNPHTRPKHPPGQANPGGTNDPTSSPASRHTADPDQSP